MTNILKLNTIIKVKLEKRQLTVSSIKDIVKGHNNYIII